MADELDLNNLLGDITLDDSLLEAAEKPKGSLAALAEELAAGGTFSPEWKMRICKPTSESSLTWLVPDTDFKEVPAQVQGVRGIPVGFFFGMSMYSSQSKETVCRTIAIAPDGGEPYFHPLGPMTKVLYNGVAYGEEQVPSRDLNKMNPYGSRGFSCAECIRNGLHKLSYKDKQSKDQTDSCGGSISLLLVVQEVATAKTDLKNKTQTVSWKSVTELLDSDGNPIYTKPFLLHVSLRAGSANWKKGLQIKWDINDNNAPKSWTNFYNQLVADGLITDTFESGADAGHLFANAIIEVWATRPVDAQVETYLNQTVKSLAGFRQVADDYEIAIGGKTFTYKELKGTKLLQKFVDAHYRGVYQEEYVALGGKTEGRKLLRSGTHTLPDGDKEQISLKEALSKVTMLPSADADKKQNPFADGDEAEATAPPALKSAAPTDEPTPTIEVSATPVVAPPALFNRNGNS